MEPQMELEEESPPPPYSLLEMPSTPFVFPSTLLPGFKYDFNFYNVKFTCSGIA